MFDFSFTEMLLAGVVALIVLGAERLPKVARFIGEWVGKIQRMAAGVKSELAAQADYAELAKIKQNVEDTAQEIRKDLRDFEQKIQNETKELAEKANVPAWERLPEQKTPADFGVMVDENGQPIYSGSLNDELSDFTPVTGLHVKSLKKQAMLRKRDMRPRFRPQPKLRSRK
nr:Sec-independent protein translocase protein TatB [Alysiella crassa]UOP08186.1 Sec-independent protein translocase protein TatB [Alysiella crassa]